MDYTVRADAKPTSLSFADTRPGPPHWLRGLLSFAGNAFSTVGSSEASYLPTIHAAGMRASTHTSTGNISDLVPAVTDVQVLGRRLECDPSQEYTLCCFLWTTRTSNLSGDSSRGVVPYRLH